MLRALLAAAALAVACRGGSDDAGRKPASPGSVVPKLPISDDGAAELRKLAFAIEKYRERPAEEIAFLLERAAITGTLEDYQAALERSAALVATAPADATAWTLRAQVLVRVHKFGEARDAAAKADPNRRAELETAIDEATGGVDQSLPRREGAAKADPNPVTLTLLAGALAQAGRFDEARALIPQAVDRLRDNTPELYSWLYFQWGRIYELDGKLAAARDLFAAARARMPAHVEATAHLVQTSIATGDRDGARRIVAEALAGSHHPELLGLDPARGAEARAAWDRYVAALPEAFSDHAARFYLGVDPSRALELARANLANRATPEARALVVEAALAAAQPAAACDVALPLRTAALRSQRFLAWRALAACGRAAEAAELARELGI